MKSLERFLPLVGQLRRASRDDLTKDVQAGLTTAVMLIPQGMAYAMIAGLPPIVGLYASVVPVALYALFGTSRQLAVGPVAMVSLLVATGVGAVAEQGTDAYLGYALLLALMVGAVQLFMGVARLGFLVDLLSHPVVSGFTSAAALIIGFSQLQHLLGFEIAGGHHVHEVLLHAVRDIEQTHVPTLLVGLGAIGLLTGLQRWKPKFPRALAVVVLGTAAVAGLGLADAGVRIVGEVPAGLPTPSLPPLDLGAVQSLLPVALTISLVGFMESIAVAKGFARRNRYALDTNRELVGLGLANLGAAFFRGYPVTGGFSRTAVNAQAGATTNFAGIVTAVAIAITLLFLTPLFHFLPKAVLAAIIMTAVFGLVDVKEAVHLWRTDRADLALLVVTFTATLLVGIEQGILIGVAASVLWFVARNSAPRVARLGRVDDDGVYRDVLRYEDATTRPDVLVVRVDAPLFFANTRYLSQRLDALEEAHEGPLAAVVLDASSITSVDSSAVSLLDEIVEDHDRRGVALFLVGVRGPVRDVLERAHVVERLGAGRLLARVDDALAAIRTPVLGGAE